MLNADWFGAPRLRTGTSRTIGARGIKTWRAFGAPSHFHLINTVYIISFFNCLILFLSKSEP